MDVKGLQTPYINVTVSVALSLDHFNANNIFLLATYYLSPLTFPFLVVDVKPCELNSKHIRHPYTRLLCAMEICTGCTKLCGERTEGAKELRWRPFQLINPYPVCAAVGNASQMCWESCKQFLQGIY